MDAAALRSAAALADAALLRGEALAHPRRSQEARLLILFAFVSVARQALARVLAPAPPPDPEPLPPPTEAAHGCAPLDASDCPDDDTLLDFVLGQLSPEAVDAMERHCDGCSLCLDVIAAAAALDGDAPLLGRPRVVADSLLPSLKRGGG